MVDDVAVALGKLARHVLDELEDVTVVAITGSTGKTSAKDLIAHVLEPDGMTVATAGNFNNELGVPLTVLRADELTRYLVVEMGARAQGDIAELCRIAPPDVGVVLNVGHAHIGEFGSAEVIAQTKGELAEAVQGDGVVVLNADDVLVAPMATRTEAAIVTFGETGDVRVSGLDVDTHGRPCFTLTHDGRSVEAYVPLIGEYHAWNAAAAVAAAIVLGVDLATAVQRLATAGTRSPMRMEHHVRPDGVVVVNDAYNANPESMAAALRASRRSVPAGPLRCWGRCSSSAPTAMRRTSRSAGSRRSWASPRSSSSVKEPVALPKALVTSRWSVDDVDVAVHTLSASLSGDEVILVKASRGGRLERVADALLQG